MSVWGAGALPVGVDGTQCGLAACGCVAAAMGFVFPQQMCGKACKAPLARAGGAACAGRLLPQGCAATRPAPWLAAHSAERLRHTTRRVHTGPANPSRHALHALPHTQPLEVEVHDCRDTAAGGQSPQYQYCNLPCLMRHVLASLLVQSRLVSSHLAACDHQEKCLGAHMLPAQCGSWFQRPYAR